ncbi:unnamed protein product [Polarella glacialis]|uniref:Uncharacterized protein n=1 Tax=Polarella glacialis TaxID=89957 RepID=A0A813KX47_POLGL|nr:unnamed protein product [Polarella glacialis]
MSGRCPFGIAAAALSLAIWMQTGQARVTGGMLAGLTAETVLDLYMGPLMRLWEDQTKTFFFDLFASHWRLMALFELIDNQHWVMEASAEPAFEGAAVTKRRAQAIVAPLRPSRKLRATRGHWRRPMNHRGRRDAIAWGSQEAGGPPRILFLGGSVTASELTSYRPLGICFATASLPSDVCQRCAF